MGIYLGIDIGGSFLKAALLDVSGGNLTNVVRTPSPPIRLEADGSATMVGSELCSAVAKVTTSMIGSGQSCEGILLTGQMHGLVPVLAGSSAPDLVITWRDRVPARVEGGIEPAAKHLAQVLSDEDLKRAGSELRDGVPLATAFARRTRGELTHGSVPYSLLSYVAHSMVGSQSEPLMHITDAAAHGFFDLVLSSWSMPILSGAGLTDLSFPRVTSSLECLGAHLDFGCPVFVPVGDHQAALLGSQLRDDELSLNIATGSQVSRITESVTLGCQNRPYLDGLFLSTVTHIPAGRALNALMGLVGELSMLSDDELWSAVEALCPTVSDSQMTFDLSFFDSATGSSGSIKHILESDLTVGEIFFAACRSMAQNYRRFSEMVAPSGLPGAVRVSGGLANRFIPLKRALLREFDGHDLIFVGDEDASLRGLLALASRL